LLPKERLGRWDRVLLTLGFSALSLGLYPKWFGDGVFNNQDVISYLRMVAQIEALVKHGTLFQHLSVVDAQNQGYALFQFYPPLSYAIPAYIAAIFPLGLQQSVNLAVCTTQVLTGWAVFSLCRSLGVARGAAALAAFAFLCFPFLTFSAYRSPASFFALAFNAMATVMALHYLAKPASLRLAGFIVATFLLPMTHVLSTLLLSVSMWILVVCAAPIVLAGESRRTCLRRLSMLLLAYIIGMVLATFEFAPIVLYGTHKWLRISSLLNGVPWLVNVAQRYTSLPNLLSPGISEGLQLSTPYEGQAGFQLSIPYVIGFVLCLDRLRRRESHWSSFAGLAVLFAIGVIGMLPLMPPILSGFYAVLQAPVRLLAVTALPGAVLLAYGADPVERALVGALRRVRSLDITVSRALCIVAVAILVGWSSRAETDQLSPSGANGNPPPSGFTNPVTLSMILKDPVSSTSGDYLVDAYHFADRFPNQPFYGNAQYFIYGDNWSGILGTKFALPGIPLLRAGTKLIASGRLIDGVKPPVVLRVRLNDELVGSVSIWQRIFTDVAFELKHDIHDVRNIGYDADKFTIIGGQRVALRFDHIVFDGLEPGMTVHYWDEFENSVVRLGDSTHIAAKVLAAGPLYVVPVLAYPQLQAVSINGRESECTPVPRNDKVYCGLRLPSGSSRVVVTFRGILWANWLSVLALIGALALIVAVGILNRRSRAVIT
jgi:hypothetical protein